MNLYRIDDPIQIDRSEIKKLAAKGRVVVQFSRASYTQALLKKLNSVARIPGLCLEIRFYAHYFEEFDASVLRFIPDASCVSIDCRKVRNLETLSIFEKLRELHLHVFEMESPDILSLASLQSVESLVLGQTRKGKTDLSYLQDYHNLTHFHTTDQTKNIDVLVGLPSLTSLSLSGIKNTVSLAFVSEIERLSSLRIMLGGRRSISEIRGKKLRTLEICRVRALEDLGNLARFPNLDELVVEDQIQLRRVEFGPNPRLRAIKILNCKTLGRVDGLASLSSLQGLLISKTALDYQKLLSSKLPKSLKKLSFRTGKSKEDGVIRNVLDGKGYSECDRW